MKTPTNQKLTDKLMFSGVFAQTKWREPYLVGRCLGAAENVRFIGCYGGSKPPPYDKRSTNIFVRTPFHTPCMQGIVCYTFLVYCRAVISLPLHKRAFSLCVPNVRLLFLTSTAFGDTKAKLTFEVHTYSFE